LTLLLSIKLLSRSCLFLLQGGSQSFRLHESSQQWRPGSRSRHGPWAISVPLRDVDGDDPVWTWQASASPSSPASDPPADPHSKDDVVGRHLWRPGDHSAGNCEQTAGPNPLKRLPVFCYRNFSKCWISLFSKWRV